MKIENDKKQNGSSMAESIKIKYENQKLEQTLGVEYLQHPIFEQLEVYSNFYQSLSSHIMRFVTIGTGAIMNIDTYTYSSIKGTLDSIRDILKKGRINDAYALLRKYYDSTIINIYSNLYLEDKFSIENYIVEQIDNWIKGTDKMPEYGKMSKYIEESSKLEVIKKLFDKDDRYKKIRYRCNNNTHYNFYSLFLLNVNEVSNSDRVKYLNAFSYDLENLFIQHLGYIFYLKDIYMMDSAYVGYLDCGLQPEEDSQYWVAPFIQKIFDTIIKTKRPDVAEEIKNKTSMHLK